MSRFRIETGGKTQKQGALGEFIALSYLRLHGYRLLERNYMAGHKEIDLIMRKKAAVAFIEVKSGSGKRNLPLCSRVDYVKRGNLVTAANIYIMRNAVKQKVFRFDVVEVYFRPFKINHIINAFYASDYIKKKKG